MSTVGCQCHAVSQIERFFSSWPRCHIGEMTVPQPCHVATPHQLPSHVLYTITGNPFFLSARLRDHRGVLRNETDEDLSPARRAFPRARISHVYMSLCNQITPRIMTPRDSGSSNESDNPDNLCNDRWGYIERRDPWSLSWDDHATKKRLCR